MEISVEEPKNTKVKTIEEIVAEFGGEIKEKVNSDTYYITKEGKEYTAYLDGEIIEGNVKLWTGEAKEPAVDDAGNINIYTPEELKWIADQVITGEKNFSGITITLRNSLDLGARKTEDGSFSGPEWKSIVGFLDELPKKEDDANTTASEATESEQPVEDENIEVTKENLKRFAGVFNGNNFSIRGMYVNSNKNYQGLFGYQAGTVQNLTIKNSYVKGNTGIGAIAGLNSGTIVGCSVQNIEVIGKEKVGGLIGISMSGSWVESATSTGISSLVKAEGSYSGGIIGYMNNNSTIINCVNNANVSGNEYVGGIVGIVFYGTNLRGSSNVNGNIVGNNYIGGISGYSGAQIENSYNQANIKGKDFVGGIVGLNYSMGNIVNSYNAGRIEVEEDNSGGIVGINGASISNCYNKGEIDSSNCDGLKIGGICGQNLSDSFIYTSYNIGKIKAKTSAEGIAGANFGTVNNSFYLDGSLPDVSAITDTENAKSEQQLKTEYLEILGENYKEDSENKNSGYPILSWQ